jgi:hypothetical protein
MNFWMRLCSGRSILPKALSAAAEKLTVQAMPALDFTPWDGLAGLTERTFYSRSIRHLLQVGADSAAGKIRRRGSRALRCACQSFAQIRRQGQIGHIGVSAKS